jgi:pSer/pThr/pTyr-binding forkhead associated (FHA) protein
MLIALDEEKRMYILDFRSKNGTTLNAQYVSYGREQELHEGDVIVLAGTTPFQIWPINYTEEEMRVQQQLQLNEKDKDQMKTPSGWAVLINGTMKQYDYIDSDTCYLSRISTGEILVSTKPGFAPFLILSKDPNGDNKFEYRDEKHELVCYFKKSGEDEPEKTFIVFGQSGYLSGINCFKYRDVSFQVVPLNLPLDLHNE